MPLVFRIMRRDPDGLPTVQQSSSALGVRPGVDVSIDAHGDVVVNGEGMSVNPNWRDASILRIPKRLRNLMPGATGSNSHCCFRAGSGPFHQGKFADGLMLEPDSATHGNIAPAEVAPLARFETDLAATRAAWLVDET